MLHASEIDEHASLFHSREGVAVREFPLFRSVFHTAYEAICRTRAELKLPFMQSDENNVRFIPERLWLHRTQSAARVKLREAIGLYDSEGHAIFLPLYPAQKSRSPQSKLQRRKTAKVLTHEVVHYGSRGGVDEFSETLNEGITESHAQDIYHANIAPSYFGWKYDPVMSYPRETGICLVINRLRPQTVLRLQQAFWTADSSAAEQIIEQDLGKDISSLLQGSDKTDEQVVEIESALLKKYPGGENYFMCLLVAEIVCELKGIVTRKARSQSPLGSAVRK